jgi:hypothetical protein
MNEQPRPPTADLEREIAREAALAYIPDRKRPAGHDGHAGAGEDAPMATKTFANLADDAALGIAKLLTAMDGADAAIGMITQAANALNEKAALARKLVVALRDSAQQ